MNAAYNREAREENGIRTPKSVMPRLQKQVAYFKSKMTLLHKKFGLDCLADSLVDNPQQQHRYKGHHTYSSLDEVLDKFRSGKPLSGFCLENNYDRIHVAYNRHKDMVITPPSPLKTKTCPMSHAVCITIDFTTAVKN